MKIVDFRATAVTVPLNRPVRWSSGVETATDCTIGEVITDERRGHQVIGIRVLPTRRVP